MSESVRTPSDESLRRFKPYPAYKDSGVEWLGDIPTHWEVKRLKYVARIEAGQSPPSEVVRDGLEGLPFLQGNADFGPTSPIPRQACDVAPTHAQEGDILFSVRAPVGAMNVADQEYGIGRGLCAVRLGPSVERRFGFYALSSVRKLLDRVATGSTYEAVTTSHVGDLPQLLPSGPEQRAIAAFLDRETARIDALVAKKERLIELLQEKRTALITRAVTKGLDPSVPMKDSGVEWLGEIPAHWEVKRNGAIFDERNERGREDLPILEVSIASGVRVREFSDTKIEQRSDDLGAYKVALAGDIAFNKMRMWQGAVGATPEDGLVSPDYIVARPRVGAVPDYFASVFRTPIFMVEVYRWSHGIVDDRNRLYWDDFKAIRIPCPPTGEQRAIAAFLDRETARIDALISKVREAIDRLKELRTALISAAVTGKIDVREEAA